MNKSLGLRLIAFCLLFNQLLPRTEKLVLNTIYGLFEIVEPELISLLEDPTMLRLKDVNQYGIDYYTLSKQEYTRYEHSVGVFLLTRKFGGSIEEQVAALLHDVSHTAFSHVADFVYKTNGIDSYQDDIHEEYINATSLKPVLNSHGYTVKSILAKNKKFKLLEQSYPDICADRLEYNLKGGLLENILTQQDVAYILDSLKFNENRWYFTDINNAKKFARVSTYLTENRWTSFSNLVRNYLFSQIINRAIVVNVISLNEFNKGTDAVIWEKLISSQDEIILGSFDKIYNYNKYFVLSESDSDLFFKNKFRGIDPWVLTEFGLKRLTEVDQEYSKEYNDLRVKVEKGCGIKFLSQL